MALAMAVALWFFAVNRYTGELTEFIDVEIIAPPAFTLLNQSTEDVIIDIAGPQKIIDRVSALISDKKIVARCSISQDIDDEVNDPVRKTIVISKANLNLPDGINIKSIYPEKVVVEFSRLERKYLNVRLQKQGQPAPGYTIENEFIYPSQVEVVGPAHILKMVSDIDTAPIEITGITADKNKTFPWLIDIEQNVTTNQDKGQKMISTSVRCEEKVRVWMSVSELLDNITMENIKISILQPTDYKYHVALQEERISLTVNGPRLMINKLTEADVTAFVDVSSLKPPGPYKQPVQVTMPNGINIAGQVPEVHIDFKEIVTQE